jgi:hypothetical protein
MGNGSKALESEITRRNCNPSKIQIPCKQRFSTKAYYNWEARDGNGSKALESEITRRCKLHPVENTDYSTKRRTLQIAPCRKYTRQLPRRPLPSLPLPLRGSHSNHGSVCSTDDFLCRKYYRSKIYANCNPVENTDYSTKRRTLQIATPSKIHVYVIPRNLLFISKRSPKGVPLDFETY